MRTEVSAGAARGSAGDGADRLAQGAVVDQSTVDGQGRAGREHQHAAGLDVEAVTLHVGVHRDGGATADDDRIVGETDSFEAYNAFQKREVTASDLESLIMLERAIMKGEQRKPGESNPMKWVTVLIGGGIGLVIVLFLAKDLGLFSF